MLTPVVWKEKTHEEFAMIECAADDEMLDLLTEVSAEPDRGSIAPVVLYALQQYTNIRMLDEALGGVALNNRKKPAATAMRRLYERWCKDADALIVRAKQLGLHRGMGADFTALDAAVGRTQAMLKVTLESLDRADEQIRNGQTHTLEEVRRELRAAAGR
jgi:hypothetical protein